MIVGYFVIIGMIGFMCYMFYREKYQQEPVVTPEEPTTYPELTNNEELIQRRYALGELTSQQYTEMMSRL